MHIKDPSPPHSPASTQPPHPTPDGKQNDHPRRFCDLGIAVIETEAATIKSLSTRISADFAAACNILLACQQRIVVIGMGKSGHIGSKIAATFASTGSPAFFVHPGEASHGDMGMITRQDVVLAISNSGETEEICHLLPVIKRFGIPLISLTGNPGSRIAQAATINLDVSVNKEACPLGLAPTSSTTAALVMGDALAIALLETRGFTEEDFAIYHPGGSLGRRLLLRVDSIMRTQAEIPAVQANAGLNQALLEMTTKKLGMTAIIDGDRRILGIFTDGDLRRCLNRSLDIHQTKVADVMTKNSFCIKGDLLAATAMEIMDKKKITALLVTDEQNRLQGVLHMHDLLAKGVA